MLCILFIINKYKFLANSNHPSGYRLARFVNIFSSVGEVQQAREDERYRSQELFGVFQMTEINLLLYKVVSN